MTGTLAAPVYRRLRELAEVWSSAGRTGRQGNVGIRDKRGRRRRRVLPCRALDFARHRLRVGQRRGGNGDDAHDRPQE